MLSFFGLLILSPLMILIALLIYVDDPGPVFFKQNRVGLKNKLFTIYKFRSMKIETPDVATHLLKDSENYITKVGRFIRKTSIDELPQLLNILKNDMSIVGPRPALYNQDKLIEMRTKLGIENFKPGITGLAQVSGRDELSLDEKVSLDFDYINNASLMFDFKLVLRTVKVVFKREGIKNE